MKRIYLAIFLMLLAPLELSAGQIRVHCQKTGVVFEQIPDSDNEMEYIPLPDENIALINEDEIPQYKYREQLSCLNGRLFFDPNIKPAYAIEAERKRDQLKQTQTALDAELGKAEPDVITVLRLQRAIEILKEDK